MKIQLLLFGITADIIGQKSMSLELNEDATVDFLKKKLLLTILSWLILKVFPLPSIWNMLQTTRY